MFQPLATALKPLRRSSGHDAHPSVDDDLDLLVMFNEARSDTQRGYVARIAAMRHARR